MSYLDNAGVTHFAKWVIDNFAKQQALDDLESSLAAVATTGDYDDLSGRPGEATTTVSGLMSASDKTKLDGVATGAEVNQNAFSNILVGQTTIASDGKTDTFEIAAGNRITLTPDAANDRITINADGYDDATTSASGLMSSSDKAKLNGIADGAGHLDVVTDTFNSVDNWNAGAVPTLGTSVDAADITGWNSGTAATMSISQGVLDLTSGVAPTLTFNNTSIPYIEDVGEAPTLTTQEITVVTSVEDGATA